MANESRLQRLTPELQALISGVRGEVPNDLDVDWERLANLALAHGVAPVLHQAWRDVPDAVPRSVLEDLKWIRQQTALRGVFGLRQRDEVLRILQLADIPCLVLKGAALARTWYGDLSLRPFVDIDLLLPAGEMARARQALTSAGYREIEHPRAPHHELPLHRAGMPCVVELHHSLTRLQTSETLRFEELNGRAITLEGERKEIRTLAPEDTLLHLCLHLLSHLDYDHGWQLRQLCDIARHLEAFAIDWPTFEARAQDMGAYRGCRAVLALAGVIVGARVPTGIDDADALDLLSYPVPGLIQHRLLATLFTALRRLELRKAATMVVKAMAHEDRREPFSVRDLRPHLVLPIIGRLLHESVMDPAQLRLWLPQAGRWHHRERLLAELLAPQHHTASDSARSPLRPFAGLPDVSGSRAPFPRAQRLLAVLPLAALVSIVVRRRTVR